jgi:hypothetical protein
MQLRCPVPQVVQPKSRYPQPHQHEKAIMHVSVQDVPFFKKYEKLRNLFLLDTKVSAWIAKFF